MSSPAPTVVTPTLTVPLNEPSMEDLEAAVDRLQAAMRDRLYPSQRIRVVFRRPTRVWVSNGHQEVLTSMLVGFFKAAKHGDALAYTFHSRRGFLVYDSFDYGNVASLSILSKDVLNEAKLRRIRDIQRRIHPHVWEDFRTCPPERLLDFDAVTTSITGKFPSVVIERLREAFEERLSYRYVIEGPRRDLSVETRREGDEFRAWFSSLWAGRGNGAFWTLISPTTAAFRCYD